MRAIRSVPHARGDEPSIKLEEAAARIRSPRPWG